MKRKNIFLLLLVIAIGGAVGGYLQYNKPHKNYAKAKADISINAQELYSAFEKDETVANNKFLSKVLEVDGEIVTIQSNPNGSITIALIDEMMGVSCTFDSVYVFKNQSLFDNSENKSTVKIKGRCDGFLTDVRLSKCSFVIQ